MSIEFLSNDQLSRLQDVRECVDEVLRTMMTDPELLELLRVRLCFDPSDMHGCDVLFEDDPEDSTGQGVVAHLFPHETALVGC